MLRVKYMVNDYGNKINIAIIDYRNGRRYIAKPLIFEDLTDMYASEPTIEIRPADFEKPELSLFIQDWIELAKGLNINFTEDFLKEKVAIQNHLKDLRTLLFNKEKINEKNP